MCGVCLGKRPYSKLIEKWQECYATVDSEKAFGWVKLPPVLNILGTLTGRTHGGVWRVYVWVNTIFSGFFSFS